MRKSIFIITTFVCAFAIGALGTYASMGVFPSAIQPEDVIFPEGCFVEIAGEDVSCGEALGQLTEYAQTLENQNIMLTGQRQAIICLNNDGVYDKEEGSCELSEGEVYYWIDDVFEVCYIL